MLKSVYLNKSKNLCTARSPTHTNQAYITVLITKPVARKVSFLLCLIEHISIITNRDDLTKENARIEQVLKKNRYQESIISKIF